VFDLGGVLIHWDPRTLYRKLLRDEAEVEAFLSEVCTAEWNHRQDEGRTCAEATAELTARHPDKADLIAAYYDRWLEMLGDAIHGTVAILAELDAAGVPLYAISNWSRETFHHARARFDFLRRFRDIVVSGEVGVAKPDPRIYQLFLARHQLAAGDCLFIDDVARNVDAARALGMTAIQFESPAQLRGQLRSILAP